MSKVFRKFSTPLALLALGSLITVVSIYRDYGITWDEPDLLTYGELIKNWFTSGFQDDRALRFQDFPAYGGALPLVAHLLCKMSDPLNCFHSVHLLIAVIGILGAMGCFFIAKSIGASGPVAFLLLMLSPRYFGDIFQNLKDIPFAAAYSWGVVALLPLWNDKPTDWTGRKIGAAALAIGAALAIRTGGVFLWMLFGVICLKWIFRRSLSLSRFIRSTATIVFGSTLLMSLFWPLAHQNPARALGLSLDLMRQFHWDAKVLYEGKQLLPADLPWSYLPMMLARTMTELVLLGLAFWSLSRIYGQFEGRSVLSAELFVFLSALLPISAAVLGGAILYDGIRHFLFTLPSLVALSAMGVQWAFSQFTNKLLRGVFGVGVAALGAWHLLYVAMLHPYEYIYFNHFTTNGVRGANNRFELDYWVASGRAGLECARKSVRPDHPQPILVSIRPHVPTSTLEPFALGSPLAFTRQTEESDVLLVSTRWNVHERYSWPILGTVERDGAPLLFVKKNPASRLHFEDNVCREGS